MLKQISNVSSTLIINSYEGFYAHDGNDKGDVDDWFNFMSSEKITIYKKVQDHRDGSRSFYCYDPDLNIVQFLWHPHLNK